MIFHRKPKAVDTKYDIIIKQDREKIFNLSVQIVNIVKKIMSLQKAIEVLDGDTYLSDVIRVQRNSLYPLIDERDNLIAKNNEMLEKGAYERITTLDYKPYRSETREYIANNIRSMMYGN